MRDHARASQQASGASLSDSWRSLRSGGGLDNLPVTHRRIFRRARRTSHCLSPAPQCCRDLARLRDAGVAAVVLARWAHDLPGRMVALAALVCIDARVARAHMARRSHCHVNHHDRRRRHMHRHLCVASRAPVVGRRGNDRAQFSGPLHGRSCRPALAGTKRAVRLAGSGTHSHDRTGHRGNCTASRTAAFRDRDCRRGRVGRSTVDGADCRLGLCSAVLDQPVAGALSFRGQTLHGRYPLWIAASRSRRLGDRGRPLRGSHATSMAVVDRSRRRPLGVEWCAVRGSCMRDLSVRSGLATGRRTRRGMVLTRWIDVARVVRAVAI